MLSAVLPELLSARLPPDVFTRIVRSWISNQCPADADLSAEFDEDLYLELNPDVALAVRRDQMASALAHWVHIGRAEGRRGGLPDPLPDRSGSLARMVLKKRPCGVNLLGSFGAKSGLGQVVRGCKSALKVAGIPVHAVDVPAWGATFENRALPDRLPYRVNIIHQNADMMAHFSHAYGVDLLTGRYNIGFWFWELPSIRSEWFSSYRYFDEIWVASEFCRQAVQCLTSLSVLRMPPVIDRLEQNCAFDRRYFHLSDGVFVFACVFDAASSFERKNPLAVIKAFRKAFGDSGDVLLCLKYSNGAYDPESTAKLVRQIAGAQNIVAIDRLYSDEENISFHAVIDCLVSAHRSEGFGLNMAEAMYFGKPVIATRYSSNLDFMTDDNSYLIDFQLTPLGQDYGPYQKGSVWAEPSVDHLAYLLRHVYKDKEGRDCRGRNAAADIRARFNAHAVGHAIRERLSTLGLDSEAPKVAMHRHRRGSNRVTKAPAEVVDHIRDFNVKHVFSVIMPALGADIFPLRRCLDSVCNQWYPFWELCLYVDSTRDQSSGSTLDEYRGIDSRIKIIRLPAGSKMSEAADRAVEFSTGGYVVIFDSRYEFSPNALYAVAKAVDQTPDADLLYCSSEVSDVNSNVGEPNSSIESSTVVGSLSQFLVVKKELFYGVRGPGESGSTVDSGEFKLRVAEQCTRTVHLLIDALA